MATVLGTTTSQMPLVELLRALVSDVNRLRVSSDDPRLLINMTEDGTTIELAESADIGSNPNQNDDFTEEIELPFVATIAEGSSLNGYYADEVDEPVFPVISYWGEAVPPGTKCVVIPTEAEAID